MNRSKSLLALALTIFAPMRAAIGQATGGPLGDTAGTILNTAGVEGIAGSGSTSGFSGIAGVWGNASAHVGVLGTSDLSSGVQGVSTSGFGGKGDIPCTGQVKSLPTTGNGARPIETYSMQFPENWMEDLGSGMLEAQRMVDVTEAMNAVKARNDLQAEQFKRAAK